MKHSWKINAIAFAVASVVAVAGSAAFAAKGPPSGGGGGGKKPPVEVSNNLSYPILELASGGASGTIGVASTSVTAGVFGTNFSYGCLETDTAAEYPNRSCVGTDGVFWDKADPRCTALCTGQTIERMYWQKVPGQTWKSEVDGVFSSETAEYVDWGDALESRTVSATSVARVETMPFDLDDTVPPISRVGFEMWHVFGTGKTEMWGARVTDTEAPQHYMYDGSFAIIHTGLARLNLAKLSLGAPAAGCPSVVSVGGFSPYDGINSDGSTSLDEPTPTWNLETQTWDGALFTADLPYSAELNIQGKYVYGYNWNLKTFNAGGYEKAGWWRLTFYAPDVDFTANTIIGAPPVPLSSPGLFLSATAAAEAETTAAAEAETEGRLYVARVVGDPDHLTFIDVCINAAKGGGGGRKPQ
jgi:hypothetical protein